MFFTVFRSVSMLSDLFSKCFPTFCVFFITKTIEPKLKSCDHLKMFDFCWTIWKLELFGFVLFFLKRIIKNIGHLLSNARNVENVFETFRTCENGCMWNMPCTGPDSIDLNRHFIIEFGKGLTRFIVEEKQQAN